MALSNSCIHQGLGCGGSYYLPSFLSEQESNQLFNELCQISYIPRELMLFKIFDKVAQLPRDKQVFGDQETNAQGLIVTPRYRYGGDYEPVVLDWPLSLKQVRDKIHTLTGQYCNHCVVNRYNDGSDYIGYHHDKIKDMEVSTGVITITLGESRDMLLQSKGITVKLPLASGSLFFLDWLTNKEYKHSIPKRSGIKGTRISLTFRHIKTKEAFLASL